MSQPLDATQIRSILDVIETALQPEANIETKAKAARACAGLASILEAEAGTATTRNATPAATPQHWMDRLIWLATAPEAAEVRSELLTSLRSLTGSPAAEASSPVLDIPFIGHRRQLN